jgi:hypothetical protein
MILLIESLLTLLLFFVIGVGIGWVIWARKTS